MIFVYSCWYLFIFVHSYSYVLILVDICWYFLIFAFIFIDIYSYLFIFIHMWWYLFIFGDIATQSQRPAGHDPDVHPEVYQKYTPKYTNTRWGRARAHSGRFLGPARAVHVCWYLFILIVDVSICSYLFVCLHMC